MPEDVPGVMEDRGKKTQAAQWIVTTLHGEQGLKPE